MTRYNRMPIWANRSAQRDIAEFRNLLVEYFNNGAASGFGEEQENETARRTRKKINMMSRRVARWVDAVGGSEVAYSEPPMLGGRSHRVDLIANVFNLSRLRLEPNILIDELEKAVGVYEDDALYALIRTFNPLFWLGRIIDSIASLPFTLLGRLGFNQDKAEGSILGKIIKGILYLAQGVAALEKLGLLEKVKLRLGLG